MWGLEVFENCSSRAMVAYQHYLAAKENQTPHPQVLEHQVCNRAFSQHAGVTDLDRACQRTLHRSEPADNRSETRLHHRRTLHPGKQLSGRQCSRTGAHCFMQGGSASTRQTAQLL